jgi:hypothetical protein
MRFEDVWTARGTTNFSSWVVQLAESFENSAYSLQTAARIAGVRPAELFAILQVGTLDDELLKEFVRVMPPKTSWLSICSSSEEGAKAALGALEKVKGDSGYSPWQTAEAAIETATGGSVHSKVAHLSSALVLHALKKAKDYGLLNDKERAAMKNFASSKKLGKSLTPKQVAYLQIMLSRLAEGGAIRSDTQDGDVNECLEILNALEQK